MKKSEFERQLLSKLGSLPKAERIKVVDYYNELYLDKIENGLGEEQIVAEWGSPAEAAAKVIAEDGEINFGPSGTDKTSSGKDLKKEDDKIYLREEDAVTSSRSDEKTGGAEKPRSDSSESGTEQTGKAGKAESSYSYGNPTVTSGDSGKKGKSGKNNGILHNRTFWIIYFAGFIVTFPLTIGLAAGAIGIGVGLLGAVIGIAAAVVAVVLSFVICTCVFTASGIAAILYGTVQLFFSVGQGLMTIGSGFVLLGLGLLGLQVFKLFRKRQKAKNISKDKA